MKHYILKISLLLLCGCFSNSKQEMPEITAKGKSLPSFKLLLTDSTTYLDTGKIPKGQPIVLFYMSPECLYCNAQTQEIVKEMNTLQNIKFYMITTYPISEMKKFCDRYKLMEYPNITAGIDYSNFFINNFKTEAVPYIAIYGKNKQLKQVFMGRTNGKLIKQVADEDNISQ